MKNGNVQGINKIYQTSGTWMGSSAPTNLDAAKQIVGAEIMKAIVANGGGQYEREEAANAVNNIKSPEQLTGYVDTMQKLLAGQLKSLEKQYQVTTTRNDFQDKLLPRAKSVLNTLKETPQNNVNAPTEADINATALKYKITPAEVRKRLGL